MKLKVRKEKMKQPKHIDLRIMVDIDWDYMVECNLTWQAFCVKYPKLAAQVWEDLQPFKAPPKLPGVPKK